MDQSGATRVGVGSPAEWPFQPVLPPPESLKFIQHIPVVHRSPHYGSLNTESHSCLSEYRSDCHTVIENVTVIL